MNSEIETLIRKAGEVVVHARATHIESKDGHANFVTEYDVMVQQMLREGLYKLMPEAAFVGEEGECEDSDGLRFIVDPIDGTTNFMRGYNHSSISVGLADGDEVIAGIVYNPYADELFSAEKGKGAFVNGEAIHVSGKPLKSSLVLFGTAVYYSDIRDQTLKAMTVAYDHAADLRRSGSAAIDLCSIARGCCDVFFEARLCPWDFAASDVIIREAGGVVMNMDGGKIDLHQKCSVLAGTPAATEEFLKYIK